MLLMLAHLMTQTGSKQPQKTQNLRRVQTGQQPAEP